MCGRFVQAHDPSEYAEHFGAALAVPETLAPSWNVAPTDMVYAVAEHDGDRMLGTFRWGLVPWFAKDRKIGARHVNARAETVHTSASFKDSFQRRRCIIPADGFYEWEVREEGGKLPHFVFRQDSGPLAFAGLWASWRDDAGERLTTCTIITTTPNDLLASIHDRMPVVLAGESWNHWLDPDFRDEAALRALLVPYDAAQMAEHPVSTLVNKVQNNYPDCIAPLRE
jgi:putative SOS response-associated peptidase YedK